MWYAPRTLQDAYERALTPEAGLQLAEGVHLGRSPQMMQVLTSAPCHHDGLNGCIHQVNIRDNSARSNACWKCGGRGHFKMIARLPSILKLVTEMIQLPLTLAILLTK